MAYQPKTVAEAAGILLAIVPQVIQNEISDLAEADLDMLDQGLGTWVRNEFMLWAGNEDLIADSGAHDPDGASAVILRTLWERLRERRLLADKADSLMPAALRARWMIRQDNIKDTKR